MVLSNGTLFVDFAMKGEQVVRAKQANGVANQQLWTIEFWGKKGGFYTTETISADDPMDVNAFLIYCESVSMEFMSRLQNEINEHRDSLVKDGKVSDVYTMDQKPAAYGYRAYYRKPKEV